MSNVNGVKKPKFRRDLNIAIQKVCEEGFNIGLVVTSIVPKEEIENAILWLESDDGLEYQQAKYEF